MKYRDYDFITNFIITKNYIKRANVLIENKDEETNACQNINYIRLKTYSFVTEFVC